MFYRICWLLVVVWLAGALSGCVHSKQQARLMSYLQPDQLKRNLEVPPGALYLINGWVVFQGDFFDLENNQPVDTIWREWYGNGFGVDAQGNIMTNAHVVSPGQTIGEVFASLMPFEYANGAWTGYQFRSIDEIHLVYRVNSLDGQVYHSGYLVEVNWIFLANGGNSAGWIEVKQMTLEAVGTSGVVKLVAFDEAADLAIINVPRTESSFVPFDEAALLAPTDTFYSFALREQTLGRKLWPKLEIKWGLVQSHCGWKKIDQRPRMVASLKMYSKFGNSGSAVFSDNGLVAGVLVGKNIYRPETFIIPAAYAQAFYRYSIDPGASKPVLDCSTCD